MARYRCPRPWLKVRPQITPRVWVAYGRPFPGEVRQDDEAVGTRGNLSGLFGELLEGGVAGETLYPPGQSPGGGHGADEDVGPLEGPGGAEHVRGGEHLLGDLEGGHGGAVHEHQVAGVPDPDTNRLGKGIDGPDGHGDAGREIRRRGGRLGYLPGHVRGPEQLRQLEARGDLLGPVPYPVVLLDVVDGLAHAGRRVVQDVSAGQPVHDEGVGHQEVAGLLPDLGLVVLEPDHLWPDGLSGQRIAADLDDLPVAVLLGELLDLL
jgi:hypothetical protein